MVPPPLPQHRSRSHPARAAHAGILALLAALILVGLGAPLSAPTAAQAEPASAAAGAAVSAQEDPVSDAPWQWPVAGIRHVIEPYRAPAHAYGPGHRGMDVAAAVGGAVVAPTDGVVAFQGVVVDRPVLTIRHPEGLAITFEPLESALRAGETVRRGQEIGRVSSGGHTPPDALHVGVRREGVYINPMLLFGAVLRARLLPCCGG